MYTVCNKATSSNRKIATNCGSGTWDNDTRFGNYFNCCERAATLIATSFLWSIHAISKTGLLVIDDFVNTYYIGQQQCAWLYLIACFLSQNGSEILSPYNYRVTHRNYRVIHRKFRRENKSISAVFVILKTRTDAATCPASAAKLESKKSEMVMQKI